MYQKRPAEELYDLQQDPYELKNLADEAAYQTIKTALKDSLQKWMYSIGDKETDEQEGTIN